MTPDPEDLPCCHPSPVAAGDSSDRWWMAEHAGVLAAGAMVLLFLAAAVVACVATVAQAVLP